MLNGRIDTQGPVKELLQQGVLDDIVRNETNEAKNEEQIAVEAPPSTASDEATGGEEATPDKSKKPRKLIEEEKRETGSVKWHIYNTYLKAS